MKRLLLALALLTACSIPERYRAGTYYSLSPNHPTIINTTTKNPNVFTYVSSRFGSIEIDRGEDLQWRDGYGTLYNLMESSLTGDAVIRCGVGRWSLAPSDPATAACGPHDVAYSSRTYQIYHYRSEADKMLENLLEQVPDRWWLSKPFYWIVRILGRKYWENKTTDN